MNAQFSLFKSPRIVKSGLMAGGLLLASSGLWQADIVEDFALCTTPSARTGGAMAAATAPIPAAAPAPTLAPAPAPMPDMAPGAMSSDLHAPTIFTLRSGIAEGRMVFIGVGGDINGKVNPQLLVNEGETVQINLINGEGAEHDIVLDQYSARSSRVLGKGASSAVTFTATKTGEFDYFCSTSGHRESGMLGKIKVVPGPRAASAAGSAVEIVRDPADLPPPIKGRPPQVVRVDLKTVEVQGQLADKTTYNFWTFDGKVPGPLVRVKVGDIVDAVKLSQSALSQHLTKLREDGLITFRREAQTLHYRIADQRVAKLIKVVKKLYCEDVN